MKQIKANKFRAKLSQMDVFIKFTRSKYGKAVHEYMANEGLA
jgi:hypothetical protein